jgi:hypothetical protein
LIDEWYEREEFGALRAQGLVVEEEEELDEDPSSQTVDSDNEDNWSDD